MRRRVLPALLGLLLLASTGLGQRGVFTSADGEQPSLASAADEPERPAAQGRSIERVPAGLAPARAAIEGLDGSLGAMALMARRGEWTQLQSTAQTRGVWTRDGLVRAVAEMDGPTTPFLDAVLQAGGNLEVDYGPLVQFAAPAGVLEQLARTPGVRHIRTPHTPVPMESPSEGLTGMGLEPWRQAGMLGRGARIAVVDTGFDGYWNLLGKELPPQPTVRSFRADGDITGGGDLHGTAVAEVIYDVAPEASLYLVNFATEVELGAAVEWLTVQGVQVISSSVGWPGTAYGDGTGTINEMVKRAESRGVVWVQAAGNFGQTHWSGLFADPDGNGFHNFAGADEGNTVTLRRAKPTEERVFRVEIFLTWDDWDCLCQDYDLFLFKGDGVVAQSTAFQNGKAPPVEHIVYTTAATGDYWIGIQRFRAARRAKLDLVVTIDYNLEHKAPQESLVVPADSPLALTIGAVEAGTLDLRAYSSQGPTKDGRIKPNLVAADHVTTVTYGPRGFPGTSASAPYVAGAAALVKGARPGLSPAQVRALLQQRAMGPGSASMNNALGAGQVFMGELIGGLFLPLITKGAFLP